MIETFELSKRYGDTLAVDQLTFSASPGRVTGFLGPNGAGKSTTMLGDPGVLLLDEPVNGLDPEGIIWVRNLLKALAAEGRTVFVSSHLMAEMAMTAEHLVVIGRGRLIADTSVSEFVARASGGRVRVSSPEAQRLHTLLAEKAGDVSQVEPAFDGGSPTFTVSGLDRAVIGDFALHH